MPDNNQNNYQICVFGEVGRWPVSAQMVKFIASECKEKLSVLINSLGGRTADAIAISSILKMHGNAHVHFIGASASAATIMSMGAKHVSMDEDALYMVHKCSYLCNTFDYFNADELQKHIEQLQKDKQEMEALDSVVAGMYARKCKKSQKDLLDLMSKESWLTAKEALEWGFVDEVTSYEEDKNPELSSKAVSLLREHGIKVRRPKSEGALKTIFEGLQSLFGGVSDRDGNENRMPLDESSDMRSEISGLKNSIKGKDTEISKLKDDIAGMSKMLSEKDNVIGLKEKEIEDLKNRIREMDMKPAKEAVSVVESGHDKKDGKPFESVSKNTDFLLSLAKKFD